MIQNTLHDAIYLSVFSPLVGALVAGLFGKKIGRSGAHYVTIILMLVSFAYAANIWNHIVYLNSPAVHFNLYTWSSGTTFSFHIGFLVDHLTAWMMLVVTFVSLLVHIYTIGYMSDDPGYQRFFAYISLFTFAMLMLVTGNNFVQLFFGWEGVGLVSYLLIGFWFTKETAIQGSLKAFLVNRVGDFGFVLGIGAVYKYFGSLNYAHVFAYAHTIVGQTLTIFPGHPFHVASVICILLFVGAMGKSAQIPLHVWLPESMEGPTPISALIHAATMVTAGIYMVSRLSPLFELSNTALSFVLIIGASGALFMGLIGIVQHDIKRVIAYSTLSQLGYMIAALGASAYAAGLFHLFTHACFKALLFLCAGSVIIGMHHEQDMRKMGGLYKYMPITYITFLIGGLALCGIPPFAGFYSKDTIIEAIHASTLFGSTYAYYCVLIGVLVTAIYTFRCFFLTFHTKPRMDEHTKKHLHESPVVVTFPLVMLAIPSILLGYWGISNMIYPAIKGSGFLGKAIHVLPSHNVLAHLAPDFHGPLAMLMHAPATAPFWLAILGIAGTWFAYIVMPRLPDFCASAFEPLYLILTKKFGFDDFYEWAFVRGGRGLGQLFSCIGDRKIIDNGIVNGSGRVVGVLSRVMRLMQTGYLYHYMLVMVMGLLILLCWLILT